MGDNKEEQSETRIEEEVGRVLDQVKVLQEAAASFISKSSKEEQNLRQRAVALDSCILKLRSSINTLLFNRHLDPKLAEKVFFLKKKGKEKNWSNLLPLQFQRFRRFEL